MVVALAGFHIGVDATREQVVEPWLKRGCHVWGQQRLHLVPRERRKVAQVKDERVAQLDGALQ